MVLFARAIASKSDIIFLDESMSALDLPNQNMVLKLIKKLKNENGVSIVFTTHDPRHAYISDKILIMQPNLHCIFGDTNNHLTQTNLQNLYKMKITVEEIKQTNKKTIIPQFDV